MGKPISEKCLACSKVDFHGIADSHKPECWIASQCYRKRNYYRNLEVKRAYERKRHHYLKYAKGDCSLCNSKENLQAHHIEPKLIGGLHTKTNIMTLCESCHRFITKYYQAIHGLIQVEE